jgi:hypothetical protein
MGNSNSGGFTMVQNIGPDRIYVLCQRKEWDKARMSIPTATPDQIEFKGPVSTKLGSLVII